MPWLAIVLVVRHTARLGAREMVPLSISSHGVVSCLHNSRVLNDALVPLPILMLINAYGVSLKP